MQQNPVVTGILEFTSIHTGIPAQELRLIKLMGEASYREYFRIHHENGLSFIIMKIPAGASSVAEEITKSDRAIDELPFINIQRYLRHLDMPVPDVKAYSPEKGLLLLEDLGDQSFEKTITSKTETVVTGWYKKAVDLLVRFQRRTRLNPSGDCIAFHRRFDADLLLWEINHFLEYGIEDRFSIKVNAADKSKFETIGRTIAEKISHMPQGLVHRDFQSRNIMVQGENLRLIDFQDALQGPVPYDLVALLRDSYVELSRDQILTVLRHYLSLLKEEDPYFRDEEGLVRDFDLLTIQRKLKDTGRFQYIFTVKKNPNFLPNVPRSIRYVCQALDQVPEYGELRSLIAKYVPEFK